jgi:CRP-like cAMP-binding protein
MAMSKGSNASKSGEVNMLDALVSAGLEPRLAGLLDAMPSRLVEVDPRRPFREAGTERNEVFFVESGILAKYKADGAGRRQIIALRFAGDGILPADHSADYGIQAIVRSKVRIGHRRDFDPIVDANPELARFFWKLTERHAAIGYEWLLNCGRRDSTARVVHLLCELAERSGVDHDDRRLANPFTQQQIADITGQTSVNVNRVFADLERQGLIRREGRDILLDDWDELRRVASFSAAYLQ